MITFHEYASKYANEKNPATGKIWQPADIVSNCPELSYKLTDGRTTLGDEWNDITRDTNMEAVMNEGRLALKDELNAAYQKIHPSQHPIKTPMGVAYKDDELQPDNTKLGDMTIDEFFSRLDAHLKN
jgi:hypothetical protein